LLALRGGMNFGVFGSKETREGDGECRVTTVWCCAGTPLDKPSFSERNMFILVVVRFGQAYLSCFYD